MAADKRENSVLFSLRELRQIEEDRVKTEESVARQKVEDERRAREDEIRKAREEEERRRQQIEDAERARVEEEQRQLREDQLRLEETERKHRIEAQARLEEQRLRMEIEAKGKMASNKRIKVLMGVAGAMVIVVAGLGFWAYRESKERDRQALIEAAKRKELEDRLATFKHEMDVEIANSANLKEQSEKLLAEYDKTRDEEVRRRIKEQIAAKRAEWEASQERQKAIRDRAEAARRAPVNVKCANPNDPLCGAN